MDIILAEARYKGKIRKLTKRDINKLPNKLSLSTTVQFMDYLEDYKTVLEQNGKVVKVGRKSQKYPGQVLGCDSFTATEIEDVDAHLYFGTGKFHPINIALNSNKDVYTFDPISGSFKKSDVVEIEKIKGRKRAAYLKYLSADRIGILVTTKPGQCNLKKAIDLKGKLQNQGKKVFIFIDNEINYAGLENFPFVQAWINTACPRIMEDFTVLNMEDIGNI